MFAFLGALVFVGVAWFWDDPHYKPMQPWTPGAAARWRKKNAVDIAAMEAMKAEALKQPDHEPEEERDIVPTVPPAGKGRG